MKRLGEDDENNTHLKRKRRFIKRCPNPLFAKWLEEWRDEATEKGHKSSYTYNKALNAVKKYPLPLRSGEEAKVLENIGDKTAKMLDEKLSEYLSNGGSMDDLHAHHPCSTASTREPCNPNKKPASPAHKTQSSTKHSRVTSDTAIETDSIPKRRRRSASTKEYVPAHRSGPYAILIALLNAEQDPNFKGYLSKQDLIAAAQPLCDTSFTIPDAGSYYTAWSSTGSMIKRNLLVKTSHPPKYSLSQEGVTLALRITEAENSSDSQIPPSSSRTSPRQPSFSQSRTSLRQPSPPQSRTILRQPSPPQSRTILRQPSPPQSRTSLRQPSPPQSRTILRQPSPPQSRTSLRQPSPPQSCTSIKHSSCTIINSTSSNYPPHLRSSLISNISDSSPPPPVQSTDITIVDDIIDPVQASYDDVICITESPSSDHKCKIKSKRRSSVMDCKRSSHSNIDDDEVCIIEDDDDHDDSDDELLPSVGHLLKTSRKSSIDTNHNTITTAVNSPVLTPHVQTPPSFLVTTMSSSIDISIIDSDDEVIEPLSKRIGLTRRTEHPPSNGTTTGACNQRSSSPSSSCHDVPSRTSINMAAPISVVPDPPDPIVSLSCIPSSLSSIPTNSTCTSSTCTNTKESSSTNSLDSLLLDPLVTLKPGEFEVVLCIDNTESTANRKSTSQFRGLLLEELNKNGVQFSVRKLNIGDFLWIARQTGNISQGQQLRVVNGEEIVLEHIIERKRMDDLAGSIIDKRFGEQKFRMKNCGVFNPIYLIEEHGDSSHCKIPPSSLYQAITNTQVLDEFFIKEAKDIRDSIAYLTVMTRMIQSNYSNRTINGYTVDTMTMVNKKRREMTESTQSTDTVSGIPFTLFNTSSIKNKTSTVSDMFGRHLIQVPNSSAEKAAAILELYPTPSHLREAYAKCSNEKDRENLLTPLRTGECKRRFGPTLSALIHKIYWKKTNT